MTDLVRSRNEAAARAVLPGLSVDVRTMLLIIRQCSIPLVESDPARPLYNAGLVERDGTISVLGRAVAREIVVDVADREAA